VRIYIVICETPKCGADAQRHKMSGIKS